LKNFVYDYCRDFKVNVLNTSFLKFATKPILFGDKLLTENCFFPVNVLTETVVNCTDALTPSTSLNVSFVAKSN